MKLDKANKRDKKSFKRRHGMRVTNKSIFVVLGAIVKKGKK